VNTITTWKCLTVKEFISNCNWQELLPQVSPKSVNQLNQLKDYLASWQSLTAYKFFTLNNWNGQTNLFNTEDEVDSNNRAIAFSLILPINQFWQCFIWPGQLELATEQSPVAVTESSQISASFSTKAEDTFTLKDLSQLF
jgi:hypothetical protein